MFATGGSFVSKIFTVLSVILIIASIIASTRIWLVSITMYEWILILVLIFGGAGLVAKVLFGKFHSPHMECGDSCVYATVDKL